MALLKHLTILDFGFVEMERHVSKYKVPSKYSLLAIEIKNRSEDFLVTGKKKPVQWSKTVVIRTA